jgi:hypothetical protein
MRTSSLCQIALCVVSLSSPILSQAQDSTKVSSAPPKLEKLEEGPNADTKVTKPGLKPEITQRRDNQGKVVEVKVENGKSTYYLKPNEQVGSSVHGDAQSHEVRGAQWKVLEFEAGKKKPKKKDPQAAAEADASAPPTPPAAK